MKQSAAIVVILISALIVTASIGVAAPPGWSTDKRLTSDTATSQYARVAVNLTYIHVVWQDNRDGSDEVYYTRSTDNGINWSAPTRLSPADGFNSWRPNIAVYGSDVHVVWHDYRSSNVEIYHILSTDNGATWGTETPLPSPGWSCYNPAVAAYDQNVHVVFDDYISTDYDIYYVRSTDKGNTWGSTVNLSNTSGNAQVPEISVSEQTVHVIWQDKTPGAPEVYHRRSTNNGVNWGSSVRLSANDGKNSVRPDIDCSGSKVHVVWHDYRSSDTQIYHTGSTNSGVSWSTEKAIGGQGGYGSAYWAAVAVTGSNVHVVWDNSYSAGNYEIYYNKSTNDGSTWKWSKKGLRLTYDDATSQVADIEVASGTHFPHVAWHDNRDGNWEIYSKHSVTGLPEDDDGEWEIGVEWVNDYPGVLSDLSGCDNDAESLYTRVGNLSGWVKDFHWSNDLAWEEDYKRAALGGTDDTYVDEVDLAYFSGHGSKSGSRRSLKFGRTDKDDAHLVPNDGFKAWGDLDMEWMGFSCCRSMVDQKYWARCFDGAHVICGFETIEKDVNLGKQWAAELIKDGSGDVARTVMQAWFNACETTHRPKVSAVDSFKVVVIAKSLWCAADFIWGQGYVYPDPIGYNSLFSPWHFKWEYEISMSTAPSPYLRNRITSADLPTEEDGSPSGGFVRLERCDGEGIPVKYRDGLLDQEQQLTVPTYEVNPRVVDEDYVLDIANQMCMAESILCAGDVGHDEVGHIWMIDGSHELQVSQASGAIQFMNSARYAYPAFSEPSLLDDSDALTRAEDFLTDTGFLPADGYVAEVSQLRQDKVHGETGEIDPDSSWVLEKRVYYGRTIDGYPMVGPGAYLTVTLGRDGSMDRWATGGWRDLVHYSDEWPISPSEAIQEVADLGADATVDGMPLVDSLVVNAYTIAYYEEGPDELQTMVKPVYALECTFYEELDTYDGEIYVPALNLHPRGSIDVPDDSSWFEGGDIIDFMGSALQGTPPYVYEWYSDIDGHLGSGSSISTSLSMSDRGTEMCTHTITLVVTDLTGMKEHVNIGVGVTDLSGLNEDGKRTPHVLALAPGMPNPFTSETLISYDLPLAEHVTLEIYSVTGQSIRTLVSGRQKPGTYQVSWDGRDNDGRMAGSGVYFCRLRAGSQTAAAKIILMK